MFAYILPSLQLIQVSLLWNCQHQWSFAGRIKPVLQAFGQRRKEQQVGIPELCWHQELNYCKLVSHIFSRWSVGHAVMYRHGNRVVDPMTPVRVAFSHSRGHRKCYTMTFYFVNKSSPSLNKAWHYCWDQILASVWTRMSVKVSSLCEASPTIYVSEAMCWLQCCILHTMSALTKTLSELLYSLAIGERHSVPLTLTIIFRISKSVYLHRSLQVVKTDLIKDHYLWVD